MASSIRAAVVGATGIGRHHAKWLNFAGVDVCAIAGSSEASAVSTAKQLTSIFPFKGKAYGSVGALLEAEKPDLVCIASPHHLHGDHVRACLRAGAHVLCEKPLLWQPERPLPELIAEAEQLCALADEAGRELILMAQYAGLVPTLTRIGNICSGPEAGIWQFGMKMESLRRDGGAEFEDAWIDLGPHPVSVLLALVSSFRIVAESFSVEIERFETRVAFDLEPLATDASPRQICHAHMIIGKTGTPERWIEVNGLRIHYEGRPDAAGVFRAYLSVGETEAETEDPMQTYIGWVVSLLRGDPHGQLIRGPLVLQAQDLLFRALHP